MTNFQESACEALAVRKVLSTPIYRLIISKALTIPSSW